MIKEAQGRLKVGDSVAIIDIGSNSVRLVAYEGLTRAPSAIFNEKALCGLGRGVKTTGRLADEAMDKALASSVLPTPGSPSNSKGRSSFKARKTAVAKRRSAK